MGVKKMVKGLGNGVGKVGKGVMVIGNTIYSKTFVVAQVTGLALMILGLITMIIMSMQKFGLTNLRPLFLMITGVVFAIVGVVMVGTSYGIRWKHRMVDRVTGIEDRLYDVRKSSSGLKRAYNINKCAKLRAKKSSHS